jgi:hypothetical protein
MSLPNLEELKKIHFLMEDIVSLKLNLTNLENEKVKLTEEYKHKKILAKENIRKEVADRKNRELAELALQNENMVEHQALEKYIDETNLVLDKYFKSQDFQDIVQQVIEKAEAQGQVEVFADAGLIKLIQSKYKPNLSETWPLAVTVNSKIYNLDPETLKQELIPKLAEFYFSNS